MADTVVYDKVRLREMIGEVAAEIATENHKKGQAEINANGLSEVLRRLDRMDQAKQEDSFVKRRRMGAAIKLIAHVHGGIASKDQALKQAQDWDRRFGGQILEKVVQMSDYTAGGALLPEELSGEVTEYLRDESVVQQLGLIEVDMPNGVFKWPAVTSGVTASYTTESTAVNAQSPSFGQLEMAARKMLVIVPVSNDFIKSGAVGGVELVSDDITMAMAEKMNSTFLRSDGSGGQPKGIRYAANSSNLLNQTKAGAAVTIAEASYDLLRLQQVPTDFKVPARNGHYVFSFRTWLALMAARDGNNNSVFLPEMVAGTLYGQAWHCTTAIPNNLTETGSADSEILFGYMSTGVLGHDGGMEIKLIEDAAYNNASGTVVAAASRDESLIRALVKHDLGWRYEGKELAAVIDCDWTMLA